MTSSEAHVMDVIQVHDETLFGSVRYNKIGLVEQVQNINNQINNINNAPVLDVYTKCQIDSKLGLKADKTQLIDYYTKTEDDVLLLEKADKSTTYTKSEDDALLLLKADKSQLIDSYTKSEDDALLLLKADKSQLIDSYTKSEDDALLLAKADKTTTYTKSEDDALLLLKADKTQLIDSYTKSQDDALLLLKADKATTYTKTEDDALLLLKANAADLTNYVDTNSAQTITGTKQFGVISATTISKLTKNDASILLAGGGDMLVSTLVNQPQLQEVRDIAIGRSKGYVFSTLAELNSWMAIPDNVAKLSIGDSLYIVDSQVIDYWWDGTQLRELETQLPDLTNVVTSLGTATGSGNAITDLSITGNIITPQKNMTFVNTDYDQNISGSKLFTSTIHSYGINYQGYDNSSVFLAGGGVRSIADIQSNSYSKSEDDALLLAKADKSQLIDSYTKAQDDALLLAKADKLTTYTKSEDDALLLLKADKTQLIDSYTKAQDDALLLAKADVLTTYNKTKIDEMIGNKVDNQTLVNLVNTTEDQIVNGNKQFTSNVTATGFAKSGKDNTSILLAGGGDILLSSLQAGEVDLSNYYTKTQDDALLLAKADKLTTYTKSEDDALLLLKADKTQLIDSYTKAQDDALLLLKADKTQLIDSYTKTQDDALLLAKADKLTTYTKSEDDALLLLKADKTQLIDSYTKAQDDALLLAKADKLTTYTKTETDNLIAQIDVGDVDLSSYYTKTKTNELLGEKANTIDLSNYVTVATSQTITANKTFNNSCRFASSIDGMSTITGTSFIKSGADDSVVLLGAGGTKPISEFVSAPTDLSNYYTKTETYSQTESNNRYVRLQGSVQQTITGRLKYVNPFGYQDETQDPVDNTYLTMSEVDAKLTSKIDSSALDNYVNTVNNQSINGTKTFNATVNATGFAKSGKDDTSVLLAGGGDRLLSSFGGIEDLTSSAFSGMNGAVSSYSLIRIGNLYIFSLLACGGNYNMGTFNPDYLVQNDDVITYIPFPNQTVDKGGYVSITHSNGLITCKSTSNTYRQCASATWVK
ncbi:MAG: hypothetical protein EZS28_005515 [Streblomastix strix]|uniref:Uncharacterized protein n=1 Tax=Streblomastix strix TaxID=222440 RepID=A0A5J4WXJ9_9EUKA|nr:MAG: hypothetical protein EZS28_005512 [Streblomastix strix]KAA6398962.1 MAG: hypothetical protein EZS28_005515 [Streblomastix strix]